MTKRYAIVSIVMNVILLLVYFSCFHSMNYFQGENCIKETFELNNELLTEYNEKLFSNISEVLRIKPKLEEVISDEFCMNEMWVGKFSDIVKRYIDKEISSGEMSEIFEVYNYVLNQLNDVYIGNTKLSQEEAKLSNAEIKDRINSFHTFIYNKSRLSKNDFSNLSSRHEQLILRAMENRLIQIQTQANADFADFAPNNRHYYCFNYPHPFIFMNDSRVKKGIFFEGEIGMVEHVERVVKEYCQIYLDGNKIKLADFGYQDLFLSPNSIGNKKHELILSWINPISKEVKMDTTYFEYNVTL